MEPVDLRKLKMGIFIAVDVPEWTNRPLIGELKEIEDFSVKLKWLHGSYSESFLEAFTGQGKQRQHWIQEIPLKQIVMIDIQFTKSKRLRKEDIEELKERYALYDEQQ